MLRPSQSVRRTDIKPLYHQKIHTSIRECATVLKVTTHRVDAHTYDANIFHFILLSEEIAVVEEVSIDMTHIDPVATPNASE